MPMPLHAVERGLWGLILIYLKVLLSLFKPRWLPKGPEAPRPTLPELEVSFKSPVAIAAADLDRWKVLIGWPPETEKPPKPSTSSSPQSEITPDVQPQPRVPIIFLISQTFRLAMGIMFSTRFPYRVLGGVVNRRAQYTLLRDVAVGDTLDHSCRLNPTTRNTPGGHLEFDLTIYSRLAATDELVWSATLTLVLLKPSGRRPKPKDQQVPASPAHEPVTEPQNTQPLSKVLHLHPDAGRRYALLDGDISPMHLWPWTARLVGFPRPVAKVHLITAMLEVALADVAAGADGLLPVPATLEAEFKSPALLPTKLQVKTPEVQGEDVPLELAKLAHTTGGLTFSAFALKPAPPAATGLSVAATVGEGEGKEIVAGKLLLRRHDTPPAHSQPAQ